MARGRTLWEMLVDKVRGPTELRYYNPLKARVGNSLMISELDLKEHNFFVREIREYRRSIGGREFIFTDYTLLSRPIEGDDVWVRIRLLPMENDPDTKSGLTHHVLVLRLYDELPYNEDFYKVVTDTTKKFEVIEEGRVTEEFWRVNDVQDSYQAEVAVLKDTDQNNQVDRDEVEKVKVEYWDYWREVKDEGGQSAREYLFVEMDRDNGYFQLWKGRETDTHQVYVF
jgi:hypothetical protein